MIRLFRYLNEDVVVPRIMVWAINFYAVIAMLDFTLHAFTGFRYFLE